MSFVRLQGSRRRRTNERRRYSRRSPGRSTGRRNGRVEGAGGLNTFARLGFVARGIIYIVIGVIAFMLALGSARHEPDRAGAVEAIATKPFGFFLLWVLVIGFAALAIWRFAQVALIRVDDDGHRLRALVYGIAYAIAFFSTLMFVLHGRTPVSSDQTSRDISARLLSYNGGQVILIVAGLLILVAGVLMVLNGLRAEFTEHLRMGWMRRSTRDTVVRLGQAGYVARGVVVIGVGAAAVDAAMTYNSAKAKGIDGVLRAILGEPFGPFLLILVALGLIAFGLLSFYEAKWRRTWGGIPV